MQKHKINLAVTFLLLAASIISCSSSKSTSGGSSTSSDPSVLTKERARRAIDFQLSKGIIIPKGTPFKWYGLVQVSDYEIQAKAEVDFGEKDEGKTTVKFIFLKSPDRSWMLDRAEFRSSVSFWKKEISQKVE
jgi:hypothetical protein